MGVVVGGDVTAFAVLFVTTAVGTVLAVADHAAAVPVAVALSVAVSSSTVAADFKAVLGSLLNVFHHVS